MSTLAWFRVLLCRYIRFFQWNLKKKLQKHLSDKNVLVISQHQTENNTDMIYRFVIVSDEADNFKLQIAIDSTATFMQLRNIILDSAGYGKEQMDSFYICDDEWNKEKEVTCMDMGSDSDQDIWIMDDTQLDELLEDEGQRMKFVFDYMTERFFKVKLKEVVPGKALHDPLCERKVGNPPAENVDITEFITIPKIPDASNIDAIDRSEFYGDEEYDEDEISDFEEMDNLDTDNYKF